MIGIDGTTIEGHVGRRAAVMLLALAGLVAGALAAAPAQGATTCSFDVGTRILSVGGDPDVGTQLSLNGGQVRVHHIAVTGPSQISCGGTTLTPQVIETIVVDHTAPDEATLLRILDPEQLAPGFTDESGGIFDCPDEIEVEVDLGLGTDDVEIFDFDDTADNFRIGGDALDWDPGANALCQDAEILTPNTVDYRIRASGGADVVSGVGSDVTGNPYEGEFDVDGESGSDVLRGGNDPDLLTGGGGKDKLFGMAGIDGLFAEDGKADLKLDCGDGANSEEFAVRDGKDPVAKSC